jgi:EmrB/QacA subfamily drug resistance transporter
MSTTSVTVALPSIQRSLGFSSAALQWVVVAYTLVFGGLLLLGGRIGDAFGRRLTFCTGIGVFTFASLVATVAPTQAILIGARALQGLGAAMSSPSALALLSTRYREGRGRNKAFAVFAGAQGAGAAFGLVVGGALSQLDWRLSLLINVPFGVLVLILVPRLIRETEKHSAHFDFGGAVLATTALVGLALGASEASRKGWGAPLTLGPLIAAAVLFAGFLALESRQSHPLVPFRIFADRSRSGGFATMFFVGAIQSSAFFFVSLYVQKVLGYSALQGGLVYLPATTLSTVLPTVWSRLITRVGARALIVTGLALTTVGLIGFTRLSTHSSYVIDILPWLMCTSLGSGLTFLPLTLVAVSRVESADVGLASGLLTTVQTNGGSLGLAVLSTIATSVAAQHRSSTPNLGVVAGYQRGFEILAVVAIVATIIATVTIGKVGALPRIVTPAEPAEASEAAEATEIG